MKKKLILVPVSMLSVFTAVACFEPEEYTVVNSDGNEVTLKCTDNYSKLYNDTLDNEVTLKTYNLEGHGDVPYVNINSFYYALNLCNTRDYSNGIENLYKGDISLQINPANDTISTSSYTVFFNGDDEIIQTNVMCNVKKDSPSTNNTYQVAFDLSKYGFDIVEYDGKCYAPFYPLNVLVASANTKYDFVYNGLDYYNDPFSNMDTSIYSVYSSYYRSYLRGTLSSGMSEEYASYAYNGICFLYDNFYGLKSEKKIDSFDSYLKENGYKDKLMSTNTSDFSNILDKFISLACDSGHDYVTDISSFSLDDGISYDGEHCTRIRQVKQSLVNMRERSSFKANRALISNSGKTLVITFDMFENDFTTGETDYYGGKTTNDTTFGLIYNSIKSASIYYPNIQNIVFDVSVNGGGYVMALIEAMGFISPNGKASYSYNYFNTNTSYTYQVDTNLDKSYDENDGYYGKYDFYVLVSEYSYSAANSLAYYAKQNNYAKIIGHKSGGGAACIKNIYSPIGDKLSMSSLFVVGSTVDGVFTSSDSGVTPDISLDYSSYYSTARIENAIYSYNN